MEQHPIPQNVTNFQFKLVGDMTLKQFGFLAVGFVVGYFVTVLPLPKFITWPIGAIFALGGIGFAFVPIEERPMDIWVLSFLKSVYSPTVFVWQKTKPPPPPDTSLSGQLNSLPGAQVATTVTGGVQSVVNRLFPIPTQATVPTPNPPPTPAPIAQAPTAPTLSTNTDVHVFTPQSALSIPTQSQDQVINRIFEKSSQQQTPAYAYSKGISSPPVDGGIMTMNTAGQTPPLTHKHKPYILSWLFPWLFKAKSVSGSTHSTQPLIEGAGTAPNTSAIDPEQEKKTQQLEDMVKKLQLELAQKETSQSRILELQNELTQTNLERQKLANQLAKSKTASMYSPLPPKPAPVIPTVPSAPPPQVVPPHEPTVRIMTQDMATSSGLPKLTTIPNVVTGIVKDGDGNLLVGVLVTVRDKEDIPLRALKTNKLGQFAASTPLQNGLYFVEIEDPRSRFTFDRAQITLNGTILPPLEVTAKSMREVNREKLAKEIFGNNGM